MTGKGCEEIIFAILPLNVFRPGNSKIPINRSHRGPYMPSANYNWNENYNKCRLNQLVWNMFIEIGEF